MADNKIDLNKFLDFVGITPGDDEELTQDLLHEKFSSKYVSVDKAGDHEDIVKNVTGRRMGSLTTLLKQQARELGVELPDAKDAKFEDLLTHTITAYKESTAGKINELESALKSGDSDDVVKEWQKKYQSLESKFKDTQSLLEQNKNQFEEFKTNAIKEKREIKLNTVIGGAMNSIKYKSDITDVERAGFKSLVNEKYLFQFDENDNPFIADKQTGKRIPNESKMGEFLTIDEVLSREAEQQKLIAVNPSAERNNGGNERGVKKLGASVQAQTNNNDQSTGRKLSPRAQAKAAQ